MITVAVVAVLAAVAWPSFLDVVRKNRRSDAFAALSAVQHAQERWRSNHGSYSGQLTAAPTADPPGLGLPSSSAKGYYTIAIANAGPAGYSATATAVSGKSQDGDGNCKRLRVRVSGGNVVYGSAGGEGDFDESAANRCWAR